MKGVALRDPAVNEHMTNLLFTVIVGRFHSSGELEPKVVRAAICLACSSTRLRRSAIRSSLLTMQEIYKIAKIQVLSISNP